MAAIESSKQDIKNSNEIFDTVSGVESHPPKPCPKGSSGPCQCLDGVGTPIVKEVTKGLESVMSNSFNEALQWGSRSRSMQQGPTLWDQCPPSSINSFEPKEKTLIESDKVNEYINTEKYRFVAGYREVTPNYGSSLSGIEQLQLAGATQPGLIYPNKTIGFRDANGLNGYQYIKIKDY